MPPKTLWGIARKITLLPFMMAGYAIYAMVSSLHPTGHIAVCRSLMHEATAQDNRQSMTDLRNLMTHIDQKNAEELILALHDIGQKAPANLISLHRCARTQSPPPADDHLLSQPDTQSNLADLCKKELTNYTDICLKRYSALTCSESAASLMLHGATTLQPLIIP